MAPKVRPCDNCRKHHLKCDESDLKCTRCQRAGRECVRSSHPKYRFRHSTANQMLLPVKDAVIQYIDETPKFTGFRADGSPTQRQSPGSPNRSPQAVESAQPSGEKIFPANKPKAPEPIYLPLPQKGTDLPYQVNIGEAFLLRYFVEELAKWFDICDPERHFEVVVPQRVRSCAPLFNAVLSVAARHFTTLPKDRQKEKTVKLGLQQDLIISEAVVLDYHNRCIAHLRLLANEPDAIMDENLLAAAVVLRFYEEIDAPFIGLPTDAATRGLQVFIEAQARLALTTSGLRHAAFWVGFRQEFHMAFCQQRAFRFSLGMCDDYLTWDPAPDHMLVNRLLIIGAHVLQYCYDDREQAVYSRYEELVSLHKRWLESRPLSFFPIYSDEPDRENGEIVPQRWYLNDCHIVAAQSEGLLNILLTAYGPTVARVGPGQRSAMESIDATLKLTVLELCGIALSNRQEPTALITASFAIAICGDRFADRMGQEVLMRILLTSLRDNNYWPSNTLIVKLRKAWGWKS